MFWTLDTLENAVMRLDLRPYALVLVPKGPYKEIN